MNQLSNAQKYNMFLFVLELLDKYIVTIPAMCSKHGIIESEATRIANDVCDYSCPESMKHLRDRYDMRDISISRLRENRLLFIPNIQYNVTVFEQKVREEKTNTSQQDEPTGIFERPLLSLSSKQTHIQFQTKGNHTMNIQDNIKLRRLTTTSKAISSLLENVFVTNESRFAAFATDGQHIDPATYTRMAAQAATLIQSAGFQRPQQTNPYTEIHFSTEQLVQADEKLMELLAILFPYPEQAKTTAE